MLVFGRKRSDQDLFDLHLGLPCKKPLQLDYVEQNFSIDEPVYQMTYNLPLCVVSLMSPSLSMGSQRINVPIILTVGVW